MKLEKKDWILLILKISPMDRIHIMKTLFLIWHRTGRKLSDYFKFEPYLYGPCSFEVYKELRNLETEGLIIQPPHSIPEWINYYLTQKGRLEAEKIYNNASPEIRENIEKIVKEVSQLSFWELLHKVYKEAPDFAINSIFKEII